jgi:hypothetical protein
LEVGGVKALGKPVIDEGKVVTMCTTTFAYRRTTTIVVNVKLAFTLITPAKMRHAEVSQRTCRSEFWE